MLQSCWLSRVQAQMETELQAAEAKASEASCGTPAQMETYRKLRQVTLALHAYDGAHMCWASPDITATAP